MRQCPGFAFQLTCLGDGAVCAKTCQRSNNHIMTRLNVFNVLKQERKAIIHSRAGLAWDGLALQMIYIIELGLAGAFMEQRFGFLLYPNSPK